MGVQRIGDLIARLLTERRQAPRGPQAPLFDEWGLVVGEMLAQKSWPVAVRKGVLVVQVADSVWMHELQIQKAQVLEKIRSLVGEDEIVDVRWTIRGDAPPRPRKKKTAVPAEPPKPLNEEESAWVQAVSVQVEDPDLQRVVKRVLAKYLRSPRKG